MNDVQAETSLPRREEIPLQHRWRLEDIYPDEAAWDQEASLIPQRVEQLTALRGTLAQGADRLLEALTTREKLGEMLDRLLIYAHMRLDEDAGNAQSQARWQRGKHLAIEVEGATAFLEPEVLSLPAETVDEYLQAEPQLNRYRHYLSDLQRRKPHTLDSEQEILLARAQELAYTPRDVYGLLTDADLEFPTITGEDGTPVQLSEGRFVRLLESRNREVRQAAFSALYGTYRRFQNTLAGLIGASVRKDVFFARSRRHESALAAALHADHVPLAVYTNLIDTVRSRLDSLHRYLRLRRRLLGLDELHMYDLYVPLVEKAAVRYSFAEAADVVATALAPLGSDYVQTVQDAIRSRWIDAYENKGKRSGAYCAGVYGVHPFILMNFQGRLDDAFTLAHELGHALHDHYAYAAQPFIYAHPAIFTAEVASTLNESLLYRHLLATTESDTLRTSLLVDQLEQIRRTVYRQVKFAEFELVVHEMAERGEPLTAESLCSAYKGLNDDYYGAETVVDEEIALEWARVPHFYSAFYVYQYATGLAASTALSRDIIEEGAPAVERYLDFLRAGSSDYPLALLQNAGVDLTSPEPILTTLDLFEQLVTELERATIGRQR